MKRLLRTVLVATLAAMFGSGAGMATAGTNSGAVPADTPSCSASTSTLQLTAPTFGSFGLTLNGYDQTAYAR